ncbi:MAG: hypothetical protein QM741_01890 [Rudaea sp.]|uniref:hypothetical protein n=1 Tax=Rudaea sp. TaxID=2136325 RepID=UPI0039E2CEA7
MPKSCDWPSLCGKAIGLLEHIRGSNQRGRDKAQPAARALVVKQGPICQRQAALTFMDE